MKQKYSRRFLIMVIWLLCLLLLMVLGLAFSLSNRSQMLEGTQPSVPEVVGPPSTAPEPQPSAQPDTEPSTEVSTEDPSLSTEPQPTRYLLSFVGDCTFGSDRGITGPGTFAGVVGNNYSYPFANVMDYFENDDCTFLNLECALTDQGVAADKEYAYRGSPAFAGILTAGSVEFANIVNNHTYDYGGTGYTNTLNALDQAGVSYAKERGTQLLTTESGLIIGIYADMYPQTAKGIPEKIQSLRDQGAEIIVVIFHWGYMYHYFPEQHQIDIAHAAIDAGADIVCGHHPHVLQPIEEYNGGIIYYSLGNFSYGGSVNPPDKDTVLLQQEVVRELDGTVHLGELHRIPCFVTGTGSYGNNFQPVLVRKGTEAYDRILTKLDGSYPITILPGYRPSTPAAPTEPPTQPTEPPTKPTEPATQPTEPPTQPPTAPETFPPETQAPPAPEGTSPSD